MKTLSLTFKGSLGKKHSLKLNYASERLDEQTVRQAMEKIAESHLFVKDNEELYQQPLAAKYIDTVSTILFNDEKKTA
ncbi:DUF2922 domain-containing protein [Limosilactobacillus caccae]|uniref:DUF2922 domain-containing protein n=1 Tax=Limosilactobacillus caccae TaxID=1926284 RepID=UPI000970E048|nr:DUF2922 domain-containing protein [Limosilactobacillus caccae]